MKMPFFLTSGGGDILKFTRSVHGAMEGQSSAWGVAWHGREVHGVGKG